MKDSKCNGFYPVISIIIIIQFLGLFAYLNQNNNDVRPLLEQKSIQVHKQVQPDIEIAD